MDTKPFLPFGSLPESDSSTTNASRKMFQDRSSSISNDARSSPPTSDAADSRDGSVRSEDEVTTSFFKKVLNVRAGVKDESITTEIAATTAIHELKKQSRTIVDNSEGRPRKRVYNFSVEIEVRQRRRSAAPSAPPISIKRVKQEESYSELSELESSEEEESAEEEDYDEEVSDDEEHVPARNGALNDNNSETIFELFGFPAPPPLTSSPPVVPERLTKAKPFHFNHLIGNPQTVIMNAAKREEYGGNQRITSNKDLNIRCDQPGKSFIWVTDLKNWKPSIIAMPVYAKNEDLMKVERKEDPIYSLNRPSDHWYFMGGYKQRVLIKANDKCYNQASKEGKKLMLETIFAYRTNLTVWNLWKLTDVEGFSEEEIRRSIIRDLETGKAETVFIYCEYSGVDQNMWNEFDLAESRRMIERTQGLRALKANREVYRIMIEEQRRVSKALAAEARRQAKEPNRLR